MIEQFPVKQIYISEHRSTKNYFASKDDALFIGQFKRQGDSFRSLLQFDITALKEVDFTSAALIMNITRNEIPEGTIQVGIYRILQGWDEKIITWESSVAIGAVPELIFTVVNNWTGLLMVDITKLLRYWQSFAYPNFGIMLIGNEYANSLIAISNTKNKDQGNWPRIICR